MPPSNHTPLSEEHLEALYRSQCASEPIHLLGSVQPHGFIVVVDLQTMRIAQVSSGVARHWPSLSGPEDLVQAQAQDWLWSLSLPLAPVLEGLPVRRAIDLDLGRFFYPVKGEPPVKLEQEPMHHYECVGHRTGRWAVLEWVPATHSIGAEHNEGRQLQRLNHALSELNRSHDSDAFVLACASVIQELSGYDRVMIYRFLPDWSGEVIAEHVATGMDVKYLGMRFPSGDIPPQARDLYERNTLRVLADVDATDDVFVPPRLPDGTVLDQSLGLLRAMSSVHLAYLRNMGVKATLVISLLKEGKLWGMVACHHHHPMVPPNHMRNLIRSACELLSNVVSVRLDDLQRLESKARMAEIGVLSESILLALRATGSLSDGFQDHANTILRHFGASDLGFRVGGHEFFAAAADHEKPRSFLDRVAKLAAEMSCGEVRGWTDVEDIPGDAFGHSPDLGGLLVSRFEGEEFGFLYLIRPSLLRVINWAGNPGKCATTNELGEVVLEPRRSFEKWQETVRGSCDVWSNADIAAIKRLAALLAETHKTLTHRALQNELHWRANHDSLTRLLNRDAAERDIQERLRSSGATCAVFMIDLDHFKVVNDTMGHSAGDRLLQVVANRLMSVTRDGDLVARLGGDEFLIISDIAGDRGLGIETVSRRLREAIQEPAEIDGRHLRLHLSGGVAYSPEHGTDKDTLLRHADIALYEAKGSGRGRTVVYSPAMELGIHDSMNLEQDLRRGIDNGELHLHFQPKVNLQTNKVEGAEALVRWRHPSMGLLAPDRFIPLAERSELINAIGRWVIGEACRQLGQWKLELGRYWPVAVNVSFKQFRSDELVNELRAALDANGLDATAIEVELTESVVMEDTQQTLNVIHELNKHAIRISLDDFGTGYSSLSYVRVLPLHALKIDRSFVEHLETDEASRIVTRGILGLSKGLGIDTIAEGVETAEQRDWLLEHGCTACQGYFFSRPVDGTAFPSVVQQIENAAAKPEES